MDLDVIVEIDPRAPPFRELPIVGGQGDEGVALDLIEQLPSAQAEVAHRTIVHALHDERDRRVAEFSYTAKSRAQVLGPAGLSRGRSRLRAGEGCPAGTRARRPHLVSRIRDHLGETLQIRYEGPPQERLRLRDLGHLRRRLKPLQHGRERGEGLGCAGARLVELGEDKRCEQSAASPPLGHPRFLCGRLFSEPRPRTLPMRLTPEIPDRPSCRAGSQRRYAPFCGRALRRRA